MNWLREEVAVHSKTKLYTLDKPVEGGSSGKFDNIYSTLDEPVEVGNCGTFDNIYSTLDEPVEGGSSGTFDNICCTAFRDSW